MLRPGKEPDAEPGDFPETLSLFSSKISNQKSSIKAELAAQEWSDRNRSVINLAITVQKD